MRLRVNAPYKSNRLGGLEVRPLVRLGGSELVGGSAFELVGGALASAG